VLAIVADDCLECDFNPKAVQLGRQIKGIRVLPEGSQQFRTDGDDLCNHDCSVNERL